MVGDGGGGGTERQSAVVIRHLQDMSGSWPED